MNQEQDYLRKLLETDLQEDLITEISLTDLFKRNTDALENATVDDTEKVIGLMYGLSYMLLREATMYKGDFYAYVKKAVQRNFKEYQDLQAKWAKLDGKSIEDLKRMGSNAVKELGLNVLIPGYSLFKVAGKAIKNRKLRKQEIEDASNIHLDRIAYLNEGLFDDYEDDDEEDDDGNLFGKRKADLVGIIQKKKEKESDKKKEAERLLKKNEIINPRHFKAPYTAVIFYKEEPVTSSDAMEMVEDQFIVIFKNYVVPDKKIPQLYSHFNGFKFFGEESFDAPKALVTKFIEKTSKPTFNTGKIDTVSVIISNYLKFNLDKELTRLKAEFEDLMKSKPEPEPDEDEMPFEVEEPKKGAKK